MNAPIRVLHVVSSFGYGGAEAFIMNLYRNIDRSKVQFDFLLRSEKNIYRDEILALGGRIYTTAAFPKHFLRNQIQVKQFFKAHSYQVVHIHANALLYMTALRQAKKAGIPCRIMHSHSACVSFKRTECIHQWNRKQIHALATDCFACSAAAGRWMFPGTFSVIQNAICLSDFAYAPAQRERIRGALGISKEQFVVGHVGRLTDAKNHKFLFHVFAQLQKKIPDAVLLLIGTGELQNQLEQLAQDLQLGAHIKFLGARNDVAQILSAMDVFVFPSLFEGLPISVVEAQANGLPIFSSDTISNDTRITPSIQMLPLSAGADVWVDAILRADLQRTDNRDLLVHAGFDIKETAKKLQDFYLSKAGAS